MCVTLDMLTASRLSPLQAQNIFTLQQRYVIKKWKQSIDFAEYLRKYLENKKACLKIDPSLSYHHHGTCQQVVNEKRF